MAAATAIIGTAVSLGGAAMNFAQASKQGKLQQQAERDAEKAVEAARAKLEENFYEGLDINLKSFEQERNALAGVGQQLVQAGQEGERGAGATAGRVMLGMQQGEQDITNRQINSLEKLEQTVAGEESRLATMKANLDLGEAQGAQIAAADAAKNQASAIAGGVQGLASTGMNLFKSSELYGKGKNDPDTGNPNSFGEYKKVGGQMSRSDFRNILGGGTKAGDLLSSIGGGTEKLFKGIFGGD
jgi:hypothetical protein